MTQLTSEIFIDFKGWNNFRKITKNQKVITGLNLGTLRNYNFEDKIYEICNNYIKNKSYRENKILLNRLQIEVISKGYDYTTNLLIRVFTNHYVNFYTEIQNKIDNNDFNINNFLESYKTLNKKLHGIKFLLSAIDYSYKNEKGKMSEYSFVNLVKNYVSYNTIINSTFTKNNNKVYLYELFTEEIENNFNTDNIIEIFKLYDFYNKFSFSVKNKKNKNGEEYFNSNLSEKIKLSDDTTNRFLSRIIEIINKKIIDLSNNKNLNSTDLEKEICSIRYLINISPEVCNKSIFMVLYKKALTERLKTGNNYEIENEFIKSLNPQDDIDTYIKMKNQINDIKLNTQHNTYYTNLKVKGNSEKYKNYDMEKCDRKMTNMKVCRSYDWEYNDFNYHLYDLPIDLSIYFDIFNAYYKDRFNERQLGWDYEICHGIIEFETDKVYNIKMNILQMALFYSLNESSKSAEDLSKELKMNTQLVGIILNTLLLSKLIYREENSSATDPTVKFYVNVKFSNADQNISIVSIYDKLKKLMLSQSSSKENTVSQQNLPSETVIRAKIVAKIFTEKSISKNKLIDEINNQFGVTIPSKYYDKIITDILENNNRVKMVNNQLHIVNLNYDDEFICSDNDSDNESDDVSDKSDDVYEEVSEEVDDKDNTEEVEKYYDNDDNDNNLQDDQDSIVSNDSYDSDDNDNNGDINFIDEVSSK